MKKITVNMMVEDVDATIDYYKKNLGFENLMLVDEEKGDGKSGKPLIWAMLKNGEAELMFQRKDSCEEELPEFKNKEIGGTFSIYIHLKDVKSFYENVKDKVEIVTELHKTWYGADEFVMKDLNGYILYFAEEQKD